MQLLQEAQARGALGHGPVQFLKPALPFAKALGGLRQRMLGGLDIVVRTTLLAARDIKPLMFVRRPCRRHRRGLPGLRELLGQLAVPDHAGFRIDFVAGAFRPQSGHRTLQLEQLEFRLPKLILLLARFPLDYGQLAISLLENGVRAAEQIELELPVLRPAVRLSRHLVELHLQFREVVATRLDALLKARLLDPGDARLVLRLLLLGAEIEDRLLRALRALVVVAAARLDFVQFALVRLQLSALGFGRRPHPRHPGIERGDCPAQLPELPATVGEAEVAHSEAEALVAHRLGRLAAETADLPADLADHIRHPRQILVGERELSHRLPALALVTGDARRLLEHRAALLGL